MVLTNQVILDPKNSNISQETINELLELTPQELLQKAENNEETARIVIRNLDLCEKLVRISSIGVPVNEWDINKREMNGLISLARQQPAVAQYMIEAAHSESSSEQSAHTDYLKALMSSFHLFLLSRSNLEVGLKILGTPILRDKLSYDYIRRIAEKHPEIGQYVLNNRIDFKHLTIGQIFTINEKNLKGVISMLQDPELCSKLNTKDLQAMAMRYLGFEEMNQEPNWTADNLLKALKELEEKQRSQSASNINIA